MGNRAWFVRKLIEHGPWFPSLGCLLEKQTVFEWSPPTGILSDIGSDTDLYSDILSGMFSCVPRLIWSSGSGPCQQWPQPGIRSGAEARCVGVAPFIKSRDPHLAQKKKQDDWAMKIHDDSLFNSIPPNYWLVNRIGVPWCCSFWLFSKPYGTRWYD
jgi:hypothetical protein